MKHLTTSKTHRERIIKTALLILAGIAILLGATFAWNDLSQHRTKDAFGRKDEPNSTYRNVTLNNQNVNVSYWKDGETVDRNISVTNQADSAGDVCVRLSVKEFMQVWGAPTGKVYTDEHGDPVLFATFATGKRKGEYLTSAEAEQLGFFDYGRFPVRFGKDPTKNTYTTIDYATTNLAEERNGIYGKPMEQRAEITKVWGDVPRAQLKHSLQSDTHAECDYNPYLWDEKGIAPSNDPTNFIRKYIELDAPVVTLEAWSKHDRTETGHGRLRDVWVMDQDGWVYWANRLPAGSTTPNLISSQTLINNPIPEGEDGDFNYALHVDMEATDESETEIVGVFGDVKDATELIHLQGKVTDAKLDLLTKLVTGVQYEVTFEPNLHEDTPAEDMPTNMPDPLVQTVTGNVPMKAPKDPTAAGLEFLFWSTTADHATAEAFVFADPIKGDITLYAIWGVKVTFQPNGGTWSGGENPQTVRYGSNLSTLIGSTGSIAPPTPPLNQHFAFWSEKNDTTATAIPSQLTLRGNLTLYAHFGFEVTLRAWSTKDDQDPDRAIGHFPDVHPGNLDQVTAAIPNGRTMAALPSSYLPVGGAPGEESDRAFWYWTLDPEAAQDASPIEFEGPITQEGVELYAVFGVPVIFHARTGDGEYFTETVDNITTEIKDERGQLAETNTRPVHAGGTIGGLRAGVTWNKKQKAGSVYSIRFWSTDPDLKFDKYSSVLADKNASEDDKNKMRAKVFDFTTKIQATTHLYAVYDEIRPFEFVLNLTEHDPKNGVDGTNKKQVTLNLDNYNVEGNNFIIDWGAAGAPDKTLFNDTTNGAGEIHDEDSAPFRYRYTGNVKGTAGAYLKQSSSRVRYLYDVPDGTTKNPTLVTIKIWGSLPGGIKFTFHVGSQDLGENRLIQVNTPLLPMLNENSKNGKTIKEQGAEALFLNCSNLTSLDPDGFLFANNPHLTSFGSESLPFTGMFQNAKALEFTLDQLSNLFKNSRDAVNMSRIFFGNETIEEIPDDLFATNEKVTAFYRTFYECKLLNTIPEELFDNNTAVTNFKHTFYSCTGVSGYVPRLWERNDPGLEGYARVSSYAECFKGMDSNKIANWSNIPSGWK